MPQKNRTVKIFGLPNPFAKPKPDISGRIDPYVDQSVPRVFKNQLESAIVDLSSARANVIQIIREASQDPDLDPRVLQRAANHARSAEEAAAFKQSERDAMILHQQILPSATRLVSDIYQTAQQVRAAMEVKSSRVFTERYVRQRVKSVATKLLSPDNTILALINAFDHLDRAANTIMRVAGNDSLPQPAKEKLEPLSQKIKGLTGQIGKLRNSLRGLKLYDNVSSTALGEQLWNKPKLR